MTRADVNTDISTKITSKTTAGSLTNTDDGANRVLMMDYVDQEISKSIRKVVKVSLSSSDILNLNTIPITLIPAVTGKVVLPRSVFQKYTHVSTAYSGGANWRLAFGATSLYVSSFAPAIQSAENAESINDITVSTSVISGDIYSEKSLLLTTPSAWNFGDGTIVLYIEYSEITL